MTHEEIGRLAGVSAGTVKRRLKGVKEDYAAPRLNGGVVHLDVTYWGRHKGLILAIDSETGITLYYKWIGHEKKQDYIDAIAEIERNGYEIKALVVDGGVGLDIGKQLHLVQMCQYHFISIIRRKLTMKPKLKASKELLELARSITSSNREEVEARFRKRLSTWEGFLKERTINPETNRWQYTHRALRSAVQTFKEKLPFLFVYQDFPDLNIPNTNNAIEGVFTALKSALRNHNGMSQSNKERFVAGFLRHRDIVQM